MRTPSRRSILSAIGLSLPFGLTRGARDVIPTVEAPLAITFRPFEEAVRAALARGDDRRPTPGRRLRVEVGASEMVQAGLQGCCNDRPFAGLPAGRLRIIRTIAEPGPIVAGVRLIVSSIEIAIAERSSDHSSARLINFASLPPAPVLTRTGYRSA